MSHRPARPPTRVLSFAASLLATLFLASVVFAAQPPPSDSSIYTVRAGDTWQTIAVRTDRSVQELLAANPEAAARPNRTLVASEKIQIPAREASKGYWYQVKRGEFWALIASRTNIPIQELINYNPAH
ncbi:MAG: LysM peptidoglycan-binding domain-containing protein, partial [Anaerolineae bacterium]|nr:LysM peptidoglycan-binding domain-containing protein [Anaerolineae bacterium]